MTSYLNIAAVGIACIAGLAVLTGGVGAWTYLMKACWFAMRQFKDKGESTVDVMMEMLVPAFMFVAIGFLVGFTLFGVASCLTGLGKV